MWNALPFLLAAVGAGLPGPSDEPVSPLDALLAGFEPPALWIGDEAPPLVLSHVYAGGGGPVRSLRPGVVTVVDFWATWCGPCIRLFPHVSELQEDLDRRAPGRVEIVAVDIWQDSDETPAHEQVEAFLDARGEPLAFTVAVDDGRATADSWMAPAGMRSIPRTFLVDGAGRIAWIGHPQDMDAPIELLLRGETPDAGAIVEARRWESVAVAVQHMLRDGRRAEARDVVREMLTRSFPGKASCLGDLGYTLGTDAGIPDAERADTMALAESCASLACELTGWTNGGHLYSLARVQREAGVGAQARRTLELAIAHAPNEESRKHFQRRFEQWFASAER